MTAREPVLTDFFPSKDGGRDGSYDDLLGLKCQSCFFGS